MNFFNRKGKKYTMGVNLFLVSRRLWFVEVETLVVSATHSDFTFR